MFSSMYSIVPLLSAVFVLAFGLFIYSRNLKSKLYLIFALISIATSVWLFGTFMLFNVKTDSEIVFWDRFVYLGVIFAPPLMHHFSLIYTNQKNRQRLVLITGYLIGLFFAIISRTDYFISGVFHYKWGAHSYAQPLHTVFLACFFLDLIFLFNNLIRYYRSQQNPANKNQTRYVFVAFFALLSFSSFAYLPAYGIGVPPFPFLGGLFFVVILGYAIIKHQLMDIKVAGSVFFVGILSLIFFVDIFLAKSFFEMFFRILAFIVMVFFGYLLVKSIQNEIKRREQVEKLAKKLDQANKDLEELDETKDNFLSMASHELNTPIAAIMGYLSMIIEEKTCGKLDPQLSKYLNTIFASSQRLAGLVKDLLNVSRIESNRIHIIYSEAQIEDVIEQSISEVAIKAKEVGHQLKFKRPEHKLPKTWLDVPRIVEVMINLIGNSVKYTDPGGKIEVACHADDNKIIVSVEDNGRGIPKDKYDHVFEKFTQVDVLKDEVKGTGLGMFISKNLIAMHKGKLWFKSSVDKDDHGTTFYFSIPVLKEKPFDPHEGEEAVIATDKPKPEPQKGIANNTDSENTDTDHKDEGTTPTVEKESTPIPAKDSPSTIPAK